MKKKLVGAALLGLATVVPLFDTHDAAAGIGGIGGVQAMTYAPGSKQSSGNTQTSGNSGVNNNNNGGGKAVGGGSDGGNITIGGGGSDVTTTGIVTTYDPATRTITMVDSTNGAVLIAPNKNARKVYDTSWDFAKGETFIDAKSINFTPTPDGYDITVNFENTTNVPQRIGTLWVSDIPFIGTVNRRDFDYFQKGDREEPLTPNDVGHWSFNGTVYPGGAYSPALVARGNVLLPDGKKTAEYAMGVSVQYDVLRERHRLFDALTADKGQWRFGFHINPKWRQTTGPCGPKDPPCDGQLSQYYNASAELPPYDPNHPDANKRTYKYSVRVLRNPSSYPPLPAMWLNTLKPYIEYFQTKYGAPMQAKDARPIEGVMLAIEKRMSPENPYGFSAPYPDKTGWKDVVADLQKQRTDGKFPRQVLWTPTGLSGVLGSDGKPSTNYRFEFTSHWKQMPMMRNTQNLLADYGKTTGGLGLWWGRSAEMMSDWNSGAYQLLNPSNPAHRARAFEELDGARAVNAYDIGFDQFLMEPWDAYYYLDEIHRLYPEMHLTVEAFKSDILHTQAGNFMLVGARPQVTDRSACNNLNAEQIQPIAMADALMLDQHEIWAYSWINWINNNACYSEGNEWNLNTAPIDYYTKYVASRGYVPVLGLWMSNNGPIQKIDPGAISKYGMIPSYMSSLPAGLREARFPRITKQPVTSIVGECGKPVTIGINASSTNNLPLSYQWHYTPFVADPVNTVPAKKLGGGSMVAISDGPNTYSGATRNTLRIIMSAQTAGIYRAQVAMSEGGSSYSQYVHVKSNCGGGNNNSF